MKKYLFIITGYAGYAKNIWLFVDAERLLNHSYGLAI
jgi:hypothetical protein